MVHQTIEDIHKAIINGRTKAVTAENIKTWLNKNYEDIKKKEHLFLSEPVRLDALRQVLNYAEREQNDWDRVKEAEVDVSFIEKDYILKGTIDLIRKEAGHVDIVDFKAENKPDINSDEGKDELKRYKRQLEIYAHIVEEKYGEKVDNMHLYYTNAEDGVPYVTFPRNESAIAKTIGEVTAVVHKIEAKDYSMRKRNETRCTNCDMHAYCQKYWCPKG